VSVCLSVCLSVSAGSLSFGCHLSLKIRIQNGKVFEEKFSRIMLGQGAGFYWVKPMLNTKVRGSLGLAIFT